DGFDGQLRRAEFPVRRVEAGYINTFALCAGVGADINKKLFRVVRRLCGRGALLGNATQEQREAAGERNSERTEDVHAGIEQGPERGCKEDPTRGSATTHFRQIPRKPAGFLLSQTLWTRLHESKFSERLRRIQT